MLCWVEFILKSLMIIPAGTYFIYSNYDYFSQGLLSTAWPKSYCKVYDSIRVNHVLVTATSASVCNLPVNFGQDTASCKGRTWGPPSKSSHALAVCLDKRLWPETSAPAVLLGCMFGGSF